MSIFGIGNALVDIVVSVNDDFIAQLTQDPPFGVLGRFAKGATYLVDKDFQGYLLSRLEDHATHTIAGGSVANTMVGIAQLGGHGEYAGKVGDDSFGALFAQDMQRVGVRFAVPPGSDATGTCIVLVTPDAQRTMFTHLGMAVALAPSDIDEDRIREAAWVYVEGYLWDAPQPRAASIKVMETAKRFGTKIAYSFSDTFCVERARDDFRRFTAEYVDLVFCNEAEARAFTGCHAADRAIAAIEAMDTGVAYTMSARGSVLSWQGQRHVIAAVPATAIDTTGAGDLYAAGVLHGFSMGWDATRAGQLGARAAAQVVTVPGPRLPQAMVVSM